MCGSNPDFPTKVSRQTYPAPEYRFPSVKIGLTVDTSEADFPQPTTPPEGSPNILLVLLDDVGFGWADTYGGLVPTPTLSRLADRGLRYSAFHTTALCAPTRAALLTGRNHHSAASGNISEMATGFPGYDGIIPRSCATIAELLSQNGYATGWWGKNHNVPDNTTNAAGPYDNWPTRMGFDYFYGFISGETDQFYPMLVRGTTSVEPPQTPEEGYQLTRDLTDDLIGWMNQQKAIAPDRPFFAYFAPGACHAPHHPPLDWRGRNAGKFDMGWDRYQEETYQRQLELGVIPPGTQRTHRPDEIPAWDDHSDDERRLFARFAENYADFLEHTDYEVGRLVDAIDGLGQLDNTIVIYIVGDNGSSAEGSLNGSINEVMNLNGMQTGIDELLPRIDTIGLPGTSPHYPVGWAWASDAPFQWTKQVASHFGGTRNPMVVSWPERISDNQGHRFQFHHVIDIAPTILEVVGISEPTMVNGVPQKPIEGVSMAYTFNADNADAPSTRTRQYFEMYGNRALYNDGWMASCRHGRLPWITAGSFPWDDDTWELYHIEEDFSQANDLAAEHPDKLRELQDLFMVEAAKYNVLPLDDRFAERLDVRLRPSYFYGRNHLVFHEGMTRLPEGSGPKLNNVTHSITVGATIPHAGADGVLFCVGGDTGGFSLYVQDGKLQYHYNWFNVERYQATSADPVPTGDVELKALFINETDQVAGPGTVKLLVNGSEVGEVKIEHQVPARFGVECMDVGVDSLSPVSHDYARGKGFAFTGKIHHVTIEIGDDAYQPTPEENLRLVLGMD